MSHYKKVWSTKSGPDLFLLNQEERQRTSRTPGFEEAVREANNIKRSAGRATSILTYFFQERKK